ncbi:hypothetical protein E8E11_008239 [Didymella keratinophila]|nr:hypothetical protein E8E11_008239 [Didymella keratinophila]
MANFTSFPAELRSAIFTLARPDSITITIKEGADLAVTSISPPPALLTTTKESRAEAQKWDLKPYSLLMGDDYTDVLFSEDIILHLNMIPSTAEHLSITWTELYTVLGDALLDVKRIEIECSEPQRLARLFMLPEAELVVVGVSCVEKGLFGSEITASDRDTREALRPDIVVCVGKEEYILEEEKVEGFFGEEEFTTRGFIKTSAKDAKVELDGEAVGVEAEAQDAEVEPQSVSAMGSEEQLTEEKRFREEEEGTAKGSREQLTEKALERFCTE